MTATTKTNPFAGLNEVKTESLPFAKIGDWIRGTLTDKQKRPSKFKPGTLDPIYEFKAEGGWVHTEKGEEINLEEGNFYSFWGKPQLDGSMRNVKIGQIFACKFESTKPSTKGHDQKIFKVALGKMDEAYMGETAATLEDAANEAFPPKE